MNTTAIKGLRLAALSLAICLLAACGGKEKARQALPDNAKAVGEQLAKATAGAPLAVTATELKVGETDAALDIRLAPDMFSPQTVSPELAAYAVSSYLKANSSDINVIDMVNNLDKAEIPLNVNLIKDADTQTFTYKPSQLKSLLKGGGLNKSAAGSNLADLFVPWAKKQFGNAACTNAQARIDNKMIRIALTFSDLKKSPVGMVSNPANVLKGMLIDGADAEFNRFGSLRAPLTTMIQGLNIDGILLEYQGPDGKTAYGVRCEFGRDI